MNQLPDIAFIGKAGAGKTTAAQWCEELGYKRLSFASPLKDIAVSLWGPDAARDRRKLQMLGVAVRDIEADTWADLLMLKLSETPQSIVVDDCRFPNEFYKLRAAGFHFIRVVANEDSRLDRLHQIGKDTTPEQLKHISEMELDDVDPDGVIYNDGDKIEFIEKLTNTMRLLA